MKTNTPSICVGPLVTESLVPHAPALDFVKLARAKSSLVLLAGVAVLLMSDSAKATSTTWTGGSSTDGNWATGGNWNGSAAPGATTGTSSADAATFNTAITNTWGGSASNPIVVDSGRNIQNIFFDGAAGNYFIGGTTGNSLLLTNSGTIGITSTLTNAAGSVVTETVNAPLVIEGAAYTIRNDSANGTVAKAGILVIGGSIQGGVSAATTLSLRGSNTNANTVSGVISNGASTSLMVNKTDGSTWYLTGLNTFTGYISVQNGILGINTIADKNVASALGAGTQIRLGQNSGGSGVGALLYTGATASSNRDILVYNGASGGGGVIENSTAGTMLTLSGTVSTQTPASASTLTLQGVGNGVLSGDIVGTPLMALTKKGTGIWVVSGSSSATGVTSVTAGTLQFGKRNSLYGGSSSNWTASNIKVSSGATLALNVGGVTDFTASDLGTILGMSSSSSTGFMTGSLLGLDTTNAGSFLYDGVIANAYTGSTLGLSKLGTGVLTLSAANTYTGATVISSGTLQLGNGGGSGSLATASAITNNGTLAFNRSTAVVQGTDFNAVVSGTGSLLQAGASSLTLNGGNTYTGATSITSGALNASAIVVASGSSSLGNATSAVIVGGASTSGTLNYTGNTATYTRGLVVGAGGGELDAATSGQTLTVATGGIDLSSGGSVTIGGSGTTVISSVIGGGAGGLTKVGSGALTLAGANTYTGSTTIAAGVTNASVVTVSSGSSSLGNASSAVVLGGASTSGTLNYTGNTATYTRGLAVGPGGGELDAATSGQTLTVATGGLDLSSGGLFTVGGNGNAIVSSVISGAGGLSKTGTGTLTISGANTYTGITNISGGTLSINSIGNIGGGASALGAPTTAANGIINLAGTLIYTGASSSSDRGFYVTSSANTVINNSGTGVLTLSGSITGAAQGNSGLQFRGTANTVVSGMIATGTSRLSHSDNGTLTLTNAANSFTGNVIIYNGTISVNSIANKGAASALGAGDTISLGQNGSSSNTGRLLFTGGAGGSSDRSFLIANGASGGGGVIENSVAGQTLTLSGSVTTASEASASTLTLQGVGNGVLSGNITGITNPNLSFIKAGTGTWTLSGSNTYTGTTLVSSGTLALAGNWNNNISLSSAINIANGATLDVTGLTNGRIELGANQVLSGTGATGTVNGSVGLNGGNVIGSTGVLITGGLVVNGAGNQISAGTVSGATTLAAESALAVNGVLSGNVTAQSNSTLTGNGSVSGTTTVNSATVNGSGLTLGATILNGSSTLSGYNIASSVTVNSGTTALTGTTQSTSMLSVSAGATLNANGTIQGSTTVNGLLKGNSTVTGNLTLVGGTLAPGNSPGVTTVGGNFTSDASSKLVAEVSGTVAGASYDQVKVSGNVSLAGTLDLTTLSGLTLGTAITLIDNVGSGTTTGYFSTLLTSGSTYTLTSSSDYTFTVADKEYLLSFSSNTEGDAQFNDVTLMVVPEPGTWAMLMGGMGLLVFSQRLRRRGMPQP